MEFLDQAPLDEISRISINSLFELAMEKRTDEQKSQKLHYRMSQFRFARQLHRILARHQELVAEQRQRFRRLEAAAEAAQEAEEGSSGEPAPKRERVEPNSPHDALLPSPTNQSPSTSQSPSTNQSSSEGESSSAEEPDAIIQYVPIARPRRVPNILRRSRSPRPAPAPAPAQAPQQPTN